MRTYSDTYFTTQSTALLTAETLITKKGYSILYPDYLWTEHVAYGTTVRYSLPLYNTKRDCNSRKCAHIHLYRMDSGNYELTYYIN